MVESSLKKDQEVLDQLGSKSRARKIFSQVGVTDLLKLIDRLNDILKEKKELIEKENMMQMAKKESVADIIRILSEKGLTLADLSETGIPNGQKRSRNIPKYTFQYRDAGGNVVTWYGSTTGRTPKDFQSYLERTGKNRLDCVIDSD